MCKTLSMWINGLVTGDKGYPLCYTAYDRKSKWYKFFDICMFWDPQHCRRTWLARRIHEQPPVYIELRREDFKTHGEWSKAVYNLDQQYNGPCPDGFRWVRSESFKWSPEGSYEDWVVILKAVRNK